ncbi:hypothetical protein ABC969_08800 [Sphingomonas qilianensis]|uniref:Secreted protein n=2 Tax=Sphingomonas qilianensis TaxID=1736690 RepID=A0ABU9XRR1_9SPHN
MLLLLAAAIHAQDNQPSRGETVREKVCRQHLPVERGQYFTVVPIHTLDQPNDSGVLLLVNCSSRRVVSLRDPNRSPRHVRKDLYTRGFRAKMRGDPQRYEVVNFNKKIINTAFSYNNFSTYDNWDGPCQFNGLELTTASDTDPEDTKTTIVNINVCDSILLALVVPEARNDVARPSAAK